MESISWESITDAEETWQVAGEIPQRERNKNVLRQGFMTAVISVGILYLCAVAVFVRDFHSCDLTTLTCPSARCISIRQKPADGCHPQLRILCMSRLHLFPLSL